LERYLKEKNIAKKKRTRFKNIDENQPQEQIIGGIDFVLPLDLEDGPRLDEYGSKESVNGLRLTSSRGSFRRVST